MSRPKSSSVFVVQDGVNSVAMKSKRIGVTVSMMIDLQQMCEIQATAEFIIDFFYVVVA